MKLNPTLTKKLQQQYSADSMIDMEFRGNDLSFKTDSRGNAILLFIGKRKHDGNIRGERYARTLKYDRDGQLIKDHWELKGKAT